MKLNKWVPLGCLAFSLVISSVAEAKRAGFSGLTALADSADTAFWNPAGITRLGKTLQVQNAIVFSNADFKVEEATYEGGDAKAKNDLFLIPGIYYSQPLNEDLFFSISLNIPSGIGSDYGKHWSGRYQAYGTSLVFVALTPSLAYKLSEEWSIAAGLNMMYVDSESKSQVNELLSDEDGGIKLDESGTGAGYVLSALYEPSRDFRIGATYRSKVDVDMDGIPEFNGIGDLLLLELNKLGLLGNKINVDFEVPQIANTGIFYQINPSYSVTADFLWLDMSEFGVNHVSVGADGITVPSMFKDMYGASLGVGYRLDDKTEFSVGAFYMSSPVDKTEDRTLFLNLDRVITLGAGVVHKLDNGNILDIKLDVADLGKAPIRIENDPIRGDLKGKFENNYAIILDVNYRFNW